MIKVIFQQFVSAWEKGGRVWRILPINLLRFGAR